MSYFQASPLTFDAFQPAIDNINRIALENDLAAQIEEQRKKRNSQALPALSPQPQAVASAPLLPASGSASNRYEALDRQLEKARGLPDGYLSKTAMIESQNDPSAQNPNSSAAGRFQFIDSTAQQYGLNNKLDAAASTNAASRLAADNRDYLRKTLGREPTGAELYLAHQQGAAGAARLLANPGVPAAAVVGADAVRLNGGTDQMTAGQFASKWLSKYDGNAPPSAAQAADAIAAAQPRAPDTASGQPAADAGDGLPMSSQMLARLMTNPQTQQVGAAIWKGYFEGKKDQQKPLIIGNRIVDPNTYQVIADFSTPQDGRTAAQKDYEYGLQNPGFAQAQANNRPQTSVTVNGDSSAGQRFFFDQLKERRDQAASAAADINAINAARGELDQGIISGAGANWKLQAAKVVGSALGMPDVTDQVAATEAFQAAVGQRVLSIVKGLGAGTGISNADRDFAAQMAGGNISLNEESIRKIFDIAEKANRAKISGYRGMAQQVLNGQPGLTGFMPLLDVEDPAAYVPPQPAAAGTPSAQQQAAPPVDGARQAADGKWYVPDPSRPGKYLMVQ